MKRNILFVLLPIFMLFSYILTDQAQADATPKQNNPAVKITKNHEGIMIQAGHAAYLWLSKEKRAEFVTVAIVNGKMVILQAVLDKKDAPTMIYQMFKDKDGKTARSPIPRNKDTEEMYRAFPPVIQKFIKDYRVKEILREHKMI